MTSKPYLRAGGGIGGLAAALALSRRGIASHVMESAPDFREIGAGIQLKAFEEAVASLAGVDFLPKAAAIEQPLLFCNGDQDTPMVAHEAEFLASARQASAQRFDCKHGVSLWRAREFALVTNAFIQRHCAGLPR